MPIWSPGWHIPTQKIPKCLPPPRGFNLSRAPLWGGQFERMVGIVKGSLYKTIGNGFLTWTELEEVVLDVEVAVNNRPLGYIQDDV